MRDNIGTPDSSSSAPEPPDNPDNDQHEEEEDADDPALEAQRRAESEIKCGGSGASSEYPGVGLHVPETRDQPERDDEAPAGEGDGEVDQDDDDAAPSTCACTSADEYRRRAQQYVSVTKNTFGDLPQDFLEFFEGVSVPGDSGTPQDSKPPWFDADLFLLGQRCARDNMFGLAVSELLSLFILFAVPGGLDPLIATGKSETPGTAFKRYLSTARTLSTWYSGDPFDPESESWKQLVRVRKVHRAIRKMCHCTPVDKLAVRCTVGKDSEDESAKALCCPMSPFLSEEFAKVSCPREVRVDADRFQRPFLSQTEMAITQFAFFGLFVARPHLFAAHGISRREREGLVHMWAVIGYCLGVDDRYNWCRGGLDDCLTRTELYLELMARPNLQRISALCPVWEHMSRCVVEGTRLYAFAGCSFESFLAYLTEDVLEMNTALPKKLSWAQTFQLWNLRLGLQFLPRWIPSFTRWISAGVRAALNRVGRMPKDKLRALEARTFSSTVVCPQ